MSMCHGPHSPKQCDPGSTRKDSRNAVPGRAVPAECRHGGRTCSTVSPENDTCRLPPPPPPCMPPAASCAGMPACAATQPCPLVLATACSRTSAAERLPSCHRRNNQGMHICRAETKTKCSHACSAAVPACAGHSQQLQTPADNSVTKGGTKSLWCAAFPVAGNLTVMVLAAMHKCCGCI